MKKTKACVSIAKLKAGDVLRIVRIHRDCLRKTNSLIYPSGVIKEWLKEISTENVRCQLNNSEWLVIKLNKQIIGFGQFSIKEKELYQLQIAPAWQNQGFGEKLYLAIEQRFKKAGVKTIFLNATLNSVRFYEKMGFIKVKNIKYRFLTKSIKMIKMCHSL